MGRRSEMGDFNGIESYIHCRECVGEQSNMRWTSPKDYSRLEVGFTKEGIQVWCSRHDRGVVFVDFQGAKHPITTSVRRELHIKESIND